MLERIDAHELQEQEVFAELEPYGPMVENLNFATISSILYNTNRKKGAPAKSPRDIAFGDFTEEKKAQAQEDMIKTLKDFASSHTKKLDRKKNKKKKERNRRG